jgi:glutamyl-tRNA synthetase
MLATKLAPPYTTAMSKLPEKPRLRFAPSPTGLVHVGNLRGALFSYLVAKQTGGTFILRLEDTDQERFVPEAAQFLVDSMRWLGLDWDEGYQVGGPHAPYVQSERLELYRKHAEQLVASGHAYRDYTTPEELDAMRTSAQKAGTAFRFTRDLARTSPLGTEPGVIRFAVEPGEDVAWDDLVWGHQSWKRQILDDFVCIKSDGFPTYNFAIVIDDHLMEIDIVTRGQEFLPTTPKNILVYEAFGWYKPLFAHLPWIMGPDGKTKLSKRHGAKSTLEYRDQGYLSDAVFNFLAGLGWNDGSEKEIYTRSELIAGFSLDRVQRSNAVFDPHRLDWMNGLHMRQLYSRDRQALEQLATGFWPKSAKTHTSEYLAEVLSLEYERIKTLGDLTDSTEYFFRDPVVDWAGFRVEPSDVLRYLQQTIEALEGHDVRLDDTEATEHFFREELAASLGLEKPGPLFMTIRYAVTGSQATPGLFDLLRVLGQARVMKRLRAAETALSD